MAGEPNQDVFPQALASLKRRGSNLLVVGTDHEGAHIDICARFLGDAAADRERVLVFTDRDERLDDRVPGVEPERVRVLDVGNLTRSGAAGAASPVPPGTVRIPTSDLDRLQSAVTAEIDDFRDLTPAELRVCIDSLGPLLEDHDRESVRAFLEDVGTAVTGVRGMAHHHFRVARDDPAVADLAPLFDAVVEVGTEAGRSVHRWHIDDPDLTTDWLAL